jgi:hypothetical protein
MFPGFIFLLTLKQMKCKTSALDIKKRDEMRENRSISRELLIQKFVNKYGPYDEPPSHFFLFLTSALGG